jgi:hypothetical protein
MVSRELARDISSAGSASSRSTASDAWVFGWGLEAMSSMVILKIDIHRVLAG